MTEPAASASWDDLFADLGLPPAESTKPTAAPEPPALESLPEPAAVEQEPAEKAEAAPARGRRRRSPPAAAVEEEPAAAEWMEQPPALAVESTEVSIPAQEPALEADADEPPTVEGGEEAPAPRGRSRRRRRGRGSKSGAAKETAPVESGAETPAEGLTISAVEVSETAPPSTESEEESEQRPRRRSRGRNSERDQAPRVAVNENDEAPSDAEEEDLEPAGRDDEIDDLSNWNVPSWAELIGSLYRPDR